ncbi:hypothetical protein SASPL_131380 [Salvia splendens]|uniref:Uncharacterized protein n=1 Tax=Salvia splendens TaxID=180675 RepID=A0A8X8X5U2_SALSN|nr:hypothetical protein SASPL_131380 [Salvia splendens]
MLEIKGRAVISQSESYVPNSDSSHTDPVSDCSRWHKLKGDLAMCSETLLKQVRSYQGSDLWKDKDRFVKFANASLDLCKVYQELAFREMFAADMHLKSTIKQAIDLSNTREYRDLVACLEDVQGALKATLLPGARSFCSAFPTEMGSHWLKLGLNQSPRQKTSFRKLLQRPVTEPV